MENQDDDVPPALHCNANLRAWFTTAEGSFELRGIADERSRFFNSLHALSEATLVLIADLVEAVPLLENPYMELRRRLLAAHQLTDFQLVEQLFNLPPLASKKPSGSSSRCWRLCPWGQENNAFFHCLFLNKLSRELRVLLIEADIANKPCVVHQGELLCCPQQQDVSRCGSGGGRRFSPGL
jgi:hypothetical protein